MESRLLERWKEIDADADENVDDEKYRRSKELWFLDAFRFIDALPKDSHCWCMHRDLTTPLLEPFYLYFKDKAGLLTALWTRMSSELRGCVACVSTYYETKVFYRVEFMEEQANAILTVMQTLDRSRVKQSMQGVLANKSGDYPPELICVLYELFTYPELLEDVEVNDVMVPFLKYVSEGIDLQLSQNQRYPGLCSLLFHRNQDVRFVAHQLMSNLEPFRNAEELEPVQPVLEKRIRCLESREVELKHMTQDSLWQGFKTMFKFLKAPALEEGIVERYPTFVGIVLNHVSESSSVFWNALNCLEQLLEVLGCKLWLRSAFSPAVLRNTLLSQCFHEKDEKIHKSIMGIFQHFLQSLELMRDGQYEKQRRYLLYFLLQQVPNSSNFSPLIRKFSSQTACHILTRSYKQASPLPPFECAHFWGPMLLDNINDTRLQKPFLEPAVELVGTVLVADAASLAALYMKGLRPEREVEEDADNYPEASKPWQHFIQQVEYEWENWYCVPLIWLGTLKNIGPPATSSQFIKAFVWAVSRLSVLDLQVSRDSKALTAALVWGKPKGCDDGGDGQSCVNAVKASAKLLELINFFKRSGDAYALKIREEGCNVDLQWDPTMAEPLLLLQMDSSLALRKLGKDLLQRFAKDGHIESAVEFVCESDSSLTSALKAFRHAAKLLGSKPLEHGNSLQHIFFLALKFYNVGQRCGGYPWRRFSHKLSQILWSVLIDGVSHGQQCVGITGYETSCSRMFELLPVVFKYRIPSSAVKNKAELDELWKVRTKEDCPSWFQLLVAWNNVTSNTIRRRWNDALLSILEDLARGPMSEQAGRSKAIINLLQPGSVLENDQRERLLLLFSQREQRERERIVSMMNESEDEAEDEQAIEQVIQMQKQRTEAKGTCSKTVTQLQENASPTTLLGNTAEQVLLVEKKHTEVKGTCSNAVTQLGNTSSQASARHTNAPAAPKGNLQSSRQQKKTPFAQKKMAEFMRSQSEKDLQVAPKRPEKAGADLRRGLQDKSIAKERDAQVDIHRKYQSKGRDTQPIPHKEPVAQAVLEEDLLDALVSDDRDCFDLALDNAKKQRATATTATIHPRRKLVKLDMPAEPPKPAMPLRRRARVQQRPPPPKLDDWLARILCLDVFLDCEDESPSLVNVPMIFDSAEHYLEVFRPLILEEFKAQLQRSREEFDRDNKDNVGMVTFVSLERVDSLHIVRFLSEPGRDGAPRTCSENDLVLISNKPFKESANGIHVLAKVDRKEKASTGGGTIITVKMCMLQGSARLNKVKLDLSRGRWHMTKLCHITPQLREFQAVSALASYPLLDVILSPVAQTSSVPPTSPAPLPELLWKRLKADYNDSQFAAIQASLGNSRGKSHQMNLVQGPPGTGKTRTIVGIVSALLAREGQKTNGKVLVCAQSNAAVDEILGRLTMNGIYGSDGQFYKADIVRSGNAAGVSPDLRRFCIETMVNEKLAEERGKNRDENAGEDVPALRIKLDRISERLVQLHAAKTIDKEAAKTLAVLEKQRRDTTAELQRAHNSLRKFDAAEKQRKKQLKSEYIRRADVVLTTLSGCGGDIYDACLEATGKNGGVFFDAVVIDEAAQALEPATLIPLQLLSITSGTCVMVGDPKQLPATVLSQVVSKFSYQRSMFERFQSNGFCVTMLNIQYRMHPEIREFPSRHFYDGHLQDGDAVLAGKRLAKFHKEKFFPPYAFFDVPEGKESVGGLLSIANNEEISVAVELFKAFRVRYSEEVRPGRIGIITPYKRQLSLLKEEFKKVFGKVADNIDFNTVDGFQGREVDILILSTVRGSYESKSIGFVADIRRMNVSLTRARFSLWIIGNAKALEKNHAWKALLDDARARGVVSEVRKPYTKHFRAAEVAPPLDRREADNKKKRLADSTLDRERPDGNKRHKSDGPPKGTQTLERRQETGKNVSRGTMLLDEEPAPRVVKDNDRRTNVGTRVLDRQASSRRNDAEATGNAKRPTKRFASWSKEAEPDRRTPGETSRALDSRNKEAETPRRAEQHGRTVLDRQASGRKAEAAERPAADPIRRGTNDEKKKSRAEAMALLKNSLLDSNKPGSGSERKR